MIGVVLMVGFVLYYFIQTPFGQEIRCVGMDTEKSNKVGINNERIRIKVMVLSTMLAALGHLIYLQNIGMLNVYTGHLKHEIFASAALLAGVQRLRTLILNMHLQVYSYFIPCSLFRLKLGKNCLITLH